MNVLTLLCLLSFLTACGSREVLVADPVVVEVVKVQWVPVPERLLVTRAPIEVPPVLTYGDGVALWSDDRSTIVKLNAQLEAIRRLISEE